MTRDDIIRMALEALDSKHDMTKAEWRVLQYHAFTALREALAQLNDFSPDWDAMAVMVEEQQRMAKRIEELEAALAQLEPVIQARKEGDLIVVDLPQVPTGGGGVSKEQEPTAYLCENAVGHKYFRWKKPSSEYKPIALYTAHAPPQRIWQVLTDEEINKIAATPAAIPGTYVHAFARAIEDKLRGKNT